MAARRSSLPRRILEGLVGPLDSSLGLWRIGMDRLDVEGPEGAGERGQFTRVIRLVHPEETVFVGVEGADQSQHLLAYAIG